MEKDNKYKDRDRFHYDLSDLVEELLVTDEGDDVAIDRLRGHVKQALEEYGADFSKIEMAAHTAEYNPQDEYSKVLITSIQSETNEGGALAMKTVWGEERWTEFKKWTNELVAKYEKEGTKVRKLKTSSSKTSGMRNALRLLTVLASGVVDDESVTEALQIRVRNGLKIAEGKPEERQKLLINNEIVIPASIPAGFIGQLEKWLQDTTP